MDEQGGLILGFDFGMKRLGVAIGQKVTGTAAPLTVLKTRDGIPNWQTLSDLIDRYKPVALIVGIPVNMDETDTHTTPAAKRFANRLQERFKVPVHRVDERLTTRIAHQMIEDARHSRRQHHHEVDDLSAVLILESWLNQSA